MANYITNDTDLTTVANAIRAKGGTSGSLIFPTDFAQAIANIPSSGGMWEEIDMGGTQYGCYDVFAILYQPGNLMEASVVVKVGNREETYDGNNERYLHFYNVPYNTTVEFYGGGDNLSWAFTKMNVYGKTTSGYAQQTSIGNHGSTSCSIDSNTVPGIIMITVFSPET